MESPTHQDEEPIHRDESPVDLVRLRQKLPKPLRRFLPSGGGHHHREEEKLLFGFITFLISESLIFLSLIVSYLALRLTASEWLPPGVSGPKLSSSTIIISVVLLASSFIIYFAERARKRNKLNQFRLLWLLTSAMGAYFLHGEIKEWLGLDFGMSTGLIGGTFYLLTGFHGLHVTGGIVLQIIMLIRSFIPGNYNQGHFGVTATSLFWHFVDGIWVVLFSILYLW